MTVLQLSVRKVGRRSLCFSLVCWLVKGSFIYPIHHNRRLKSSCNNNQYESYQFCSPKARCFAMEQVAKKAKIIDVADPESKEQEWANVKGVMLDLSVTCHVELSCIPGAPEAVEKLLASDIKVRFVTNTTKKCKDVLLSELQKAGFQGLTPDLLFTSASATRAVVERAGLRPYLLVEPALEPDFEGVNTADPNAVVVGLAPSRFNYPHMNQAFRLAMGGAKVVAIHKGKYWRDAGGGLSLGPGPFVEYAAGVEAQVVGKPTPSFFQSALDDMGIQADECVMIGDDLRDDVGGAMQCGIAGILVRTGKFLAKDESNTEIMPTAVHDSVVTAIEDILSCTNIKA